MFLNEDRTTSEVKGHPFWMPGVFPSYLLIRTRAAVLQLITTSQNPFYSDIVNTVLRPVSVCYDFEFRVYGRIKVPIKAQFVKIMAPWMLYSLLFSIRPANDGLNTAVQIYCHWQCSLFVLTELYWDQPGSNLESRLCFSTRKLGSYYEKMFQRQSSAARRRLRDHTTCSHFLGMIRMFLTNMLRLSGWQAVCWWFPWPQLCGFPQLDDLKEPPGQQMIHLCRDNIYWPVFVWKNALGKTDCHCFSF